MTTPGPTVPLPRHVDVAVPPQWRRRSDPGRGVLLSARSAFLPDSGVRPEVVVRCAAVDEPLDRWRTAAMHELGRRLADFALEDDDEFVLGEHDVAYRRFAHRVGTADVLCEQWAWLVDGLGITLTGACAREDYPDFCDLFETVAETLEVSASTPAA
jgi:hypothetical protein